MDDWQPLSSTNLSTMRYAPVAQDLQIRFKSGRTYSYGSVPQSIADGLAQADSPGAYFNSNVKGIFQES